MLLHDLIIFPDGWIWTWIKVSLTGPEEVEMQPNTYMKSASFPVVQSILGRRENSERLSSQSLASDLHKLEQSQYLHMKEVFCFSVIVNSSVIEMNINKRWVGKIPNTLICN